MPKEAVLQSARINTVDRASPPAAEPGTVTKHSTVRPLLSRSLRQTQPNEDKLLSVRPFPFQMDRVNLWKCIRGGVDEDVVDMLTELYQLAFKQKRFQWLKGMKLRSLFLYCLKNFQLLSI